MRLTLSSQAQVTQLHLSLPAPTGLGPNGQTGNSDADESGPEIHPMVDEPPPAPRHKPYRCPDKLCTDRAFGRSQDLVRHYWQRNSPPNVLHPLIVRAFTDRVLAC